MIHIDSDVFTYDAATDMSKENFVVTGVDDSAPVIAALERASERFMRVDSTGTEHASYDSLSAAVVDGLDSPSYVSDPEATDLGVEVYVDCNGVIDDDMARTMRQILTEELTAAGYSGTISAVNPSD
ncbi:MAG: hypothetical protein IE926_15840 [Micrococcales bacterium]|nr:hypothetical protein [Micrococcales bacterium]